MAVEKKPSHEPMTQKYKPLKRDYCYVLQSVSCSIVSEVCSLHSPDLAFSSSSCSKGARADLVILRSIGQTLTDLNMLVFQVSLLSGLELQTKVR